MTRTIQLILCLLLFTLSTQAQEIPADLVLLNGKVFTSDLGQPFQEAVAIRDGRIIAVGTAAQIEKLASATTQRIDLQGHVVVPGLNDAHFHFAPDPKGFRLSFESMEPSWSQVSEAISSAVKQVPKGTWIFGSVGRDVVLNEEVTRFALDRIAPDHPVLLRAYYGHGYILNSAAMPLLQIAEEEPDPSGGFYERVAKTRKINGRLWEYAEWKPNRALVAQVSDDEAVAELKQMAAEAVHFGITSMQVFPSMPIDRFARLLVKADLPIRVRAIPFPATDAKGRDLTELRQLGNLKRANSKITISGIKWILDGTPIERGAALRRDYADRPGWRGRLNFGENEIDSMLRESLDYKQQLLVHAVGDRTIQLVLDAMERRKAVNWNWERVRLEHGDGLIEEMMARAQRLGVIVVQNPTHFSEPEFFQRRWGTQMFVLRSLIEAGIPLALGSDGPMNPFLNIMFATLHPYNPKEAITREQAVRAYTFGSAFAEFAESKKGTIAPGKIADLAVLSQDIFTAPPPELPKTTSVMTILGGKIVYDAKVLQTQTPLPTSNVAETEAKEELIKAAQAYREGNFAEAQAHSEKALLLDPQNKTAPYFVARSIHAQYKPGDFTPENVAKAREAIIAYKKILERSPSDEEAYKAVAFLYAAIKEDEALREWILQRASDVSIDNDKRAEAFVVLASKDWDCSFKITEVPGTKVTVGDGDKTYVSYRMPKQRVEFERAKECANRALELANMAITLTPENESAWSYKTSILLELSKLAEMAGEVQRKRELQRQYEKLLTRQ